MRSKIAVQAGSVVNAPAGLTSAQCVMPKTLPAVPAEKGNAQTEAASSVSNLFSAGAPKLPTRYVNAQRMLEELFEEDSRPSIRWVRTMCSSRKIPFVRFGGKICFDCAAVQAHFAAKGAR